MNEIRCTTCGSDEVYFALDRRKRILRWYAMWWLVLPVLLFPPMFLVLTLWGVGPLYIVLTDRWSCRVCGTSWNRADPPRPMHPMSPAAAPASA